MFARETGANRMKVTQLSRFLQPRGTQDQEDRGGVTGLAGGFPRFRLTSCFEQVAQIDELAALRRCYDLHDVTLLWLLGDTLSHANDGAHFTALFTVYSAESDTTNPQ